MANRLPGFTVSRIKGQAALVRSLRGLLLRAHRFANHRARTRGEALWAGRLIDGLSDTLARVATAQTTKGADG